MRQQKSKKTPSSVALFSKKPQGFIKNTEVGRGGIRTKNVPSLPCRAGSPFFKRVRIIRSTFNENEPGQHHVEDSVIMAQ